MPSEPYPGHIPRIHLRCEGPDSANASDTLLFMHGWPDDAQIWDSQVACFRRAYRCLRYTLPWYGPVAEADKEAAERGHSRWGYDFHVIADALALALHAADITSLTVVAHDWGAVHALYFCSRHKALVRRLVLVDVGPGIAFPQTPRFRQIPAMLTIGVLYQYEMISAWALSAVSRPAGVHIAICDRPTRCELYVCRPLHVVAGFCVAICRPVACTPGRVMGTGRTHPRRFRRQQSQRPRQERRHSGREWLPLLLLPSPVRARAARYPSTRVSAARGDRLPSCFRLRRQEARHVPLSFLGALAECTSGWLKGSGPEMRPLGPSGAVGRVQRTYERMALVRGRR